VSRVKSSTLSSPLATYTSLSTPLLLLATSESHSPFPRRSAQRLMHSYQQPPILDITLEEFETFAIDRLRILSYIESLQHRSLPYAQFQTQIATYLKTHLPLSSNTARSANLEQERRADEIGHWVLRLAFCRSYVSSSSRPCCLSCFLNRPLTSCLLSSKALLNILLISKYNDPHSS